MTNSPDPLEQWYRDNDLDGKCAPTYWEVVIGVFLIACVVLGLLYSLL